MPSVTLIAYATRGGSTASVAEVIAESLNDAGCLAESLPMHSIESLQNRDAVILGAPLYFGRFPAEFHQFLVQHQQALSGLHPWLFVLGPTRNDPADFASARQQADRQLSRYPWLYPAAVQIFGGRFDPEHIPFPFSAVRHLPAFIRKEIPTMDIRDWPEIRRWARGIGAQSKPAA